MPEPSVPAFFALAPLSTVLQSGSAEVVRWDSALTPSVSTIAVVAMDTDALAGTFLGAMDRLLAVPLPGGDAVERLMASKAAVATALSRRLVPVFTEQTAGDPAAATSQFEAWLNIRLGNASDSPAVVLAQLPWPAAPLWMSLMAMVAAPEKQIAIRLQPGGVTIPLPLRAYPAPVMLMEQTAMPCGADADRIEEAIAAALRWDYVATLDKRDLAAQDDLWISVQFGDPRPASIAAEAPLNPLTRELLKFQIGFASLEPLLPFLDVTGPKADKLADILAALAGETADAFLAPDTAGHDMAPPSADWLLRYAGLSEDILTLFGRSDATIGFPSLNGVLPVNPPAPAEQDGWVQAQYKFPNGVPARLTLTIAGLNLVTAPSGWLQARIVRNASLGATTDPRLIYRTPAAAFSNPVVPSLEVEHALGPFGGAPVDDMVESILKPFAQAGEAARLRISVEYSYRLLDGLPAVTLPVTILPEVRTGEPAATAAALMASLRQWIGQIAPPREGATFVFQLVFCVSVPRATIGPISLTIPPDWS